MLKTNELKAARVRAGITQAELAKKLGTVPSNFSMKENGKSQFKAGEIETIAKTLKLSQDDIAKIFFA